MVPTGHSVQGCWPHRYQASTIAYNQTQSVDNCEILPTKILPLDIIKFQHSICCVELWTFLNVIQMIQSNEPITFAPQFHSCPQSVKDCLNLCQSERFKICHTTSLTVLEFQNFFRKIQSKILLTWYFHHRI